MMRERRSRAALALGTAVLLCACSPGENRPGIQSIRRLNESEYRSTIADVFGKKIEVMGRFEPDARQHGLNALGTASLSISRSGFEQYAAIAYGVITQALDPKNEEQILECGPDDAKAYDEACAREKDVKVDVHQKVDHDAGDRHFGPDIEKDREPPQQRPA